MEEGEEEEGEGKRIGRLRPIKPRYHVTWKCGHLHQKVNSVSLIFIMRGQPPPPPPSPPSPPPPPPLPTRIITQAIMNNRHHEPS